MKHFMNIVIIRWIISLGVILVLAMYLILTFTSPNAHTSSTIKGQSRSVNQSAMALVSPIPPVQLTPNELAIAKLGMQLFLDPNLSSNGRVSCESCHHIFTNGAEDIKVSKGVKGNGVRNSPTVFNIAHNSRFFWDGRASSLESQMDGPVHNPLEMNTNWQKISDYVSSVSDYKDKFSKHFEGKINEANIKASLKSFMVALDTPDAPFDQYLDGNKSALPAAAQNGWKKFQDLGCVICHQGTNVGGNLFQKFGNVNSTGELEKDLGRYNVTGIESDKGVFRVPSLRNVANTAPYFHDGRAQTLESAIVTMARVQLGRDLDATTILELTAFLNALTAPPPPILEELLP